MVLTASNPAGLEMLMSIACLYAAATGELGVLIVVTVPEGPIDVDEL